MFKIDIENTSDLNAAIPPLKEIAENKDEKGEDKVEQVATEDLGQEIKGLGSSDDKTDIPEDATKLEEKPAKTSVPEKDNKYWAKLRKERAEKAAMAEHLLHLQFFLL